MPRREGLACDPGSRSKEDAPMFDPSGFSEKGLGEAVDEFVRYLLQVLDVFLATLLLPFRLFDALL